MSNSASSLFPLGPDTTPYRKISDDGVAIERFGAFITAYAFSGATSLFDRAATSTARLFASPHSIWNAENMIKDEYL